MHSKHGFVVVLRQIFPSCLHQPLPPFRVQAFGLQEMTEGTSCAVKRWKEVTVAPARTPMPTNRMKSFQTFMSGRGN